MLLTTHDKSKRFATKGNVDASLTRVREGKHNFLDGKLPMKRHTMIPRRVDVYGTMPLTIDPACGGGSRSGAWLQH